MVVEAISGRIFVMMKIDICLSFEGSNEWTNRPSSGTRASAGGTFVNPVTIGVHGYVGNTELCLIIHF